MRLLENDIQTVSQTFDRRHKSEIQKLHGHRSDTLFEK